MHAIGCECCACQNSSSLSSSLLKIRVLELVMVGMSGVGMEVGVLYLHKIDPSRTYSFSSLDFTRLTSLLAFASTALFVTVDIRENKRRWKSIESKPFCDACREERETLRTTQKWTLNYLCFLQSLFIASLFLCCAFWLIVDMPKHYNHHLEVILKMLGCLFDLFIGLAYAKSCLDSYSLFEIASIRSFKCAGFASRSNSRAPYAGESFSDDEEENLHESLLSSDKKFNKGRTYTKLSNM